MLHHINFETIYPIWKNKLWPDRISDITGTSAMKYLGNYDNKNMEYSPTFLAYFLNNQIVGVNSGHQCMDNGYRSRGLYVFPEYRGQGIGIELLKATIKKGKELGCNYVWSYPKDSSWSTYHKAGFSLSSDWEKSETGINAYCICEI